MRKINEIILHCSDSDKKYNFTAKHLNDWHKVRGFDCIGYHFVIDLDGKLENCNSFGRPISKIGAHCKNHNAHSIGICYVGGQLNGEHCNTINLSQIDTLFKLLVRLLIDFDLNYKDIKLHYEYNHHKVCPCFKRKWFDDVFKDRIQLELKKYQLF